MTGTTERPGPRDDILRLTKYWKDGYDWRAHEAKLKRRAAAVQDDHARRRLRKPPRSLCVHKQSPRPGSIPLLLLPRMYVRLVSSAFTTLASPFHVVAPSLPNFGFSEGVRKKGFRIPQYAETLHKVMLRLGCNRYVTQGGDWGYIITRVVGLQYPSSCLASRVNFIRAQRRERGGTQDRGWVENAILDGESESRSKEEATDGVGVDSECLAVNPAT